jgi:hypothetical protein
MEKKQELEQKLSAARSEFNFALNKIGLWTYQIQRELPAEIEKQYNVVHDLVIRIEKLTKELNDMTAKPVQAEIV